MDILLSGFFGALFATILNIIYLYIAEQKKIRAEVLIDVVSFWDDTTNNLLRLLTREPTNINILNRLPKKRSIDEIILNKLFEETLVKVDLLQVSIFIYTPRSKIVLLYGEGDVLNKFDILRTGISELLKILSGATILNYDEKNDEFRDKFNHVLPLMDSLEAKLLEETSVSSIIHQAIESVKSIFIKSKQPPSHS